MCAAGRCSLRAHSPDHRPASRPSQCPGGSAGLLNRGAVSAAALLALSCWREARCPQSRRDSSPRLGPGTEGRRVSHRSFTSWGCRPSGLPSVMSAWGVLPLQAADVAPNGSMSVPTATTRSDGTARRVSTHLSRCRHGVAGGGSRYGVLKQRALPSLTCANRLPSGRSIRTALHNLADTVPAVSTKLGNVPKSTRGLYDVAHGDRGSSALPTHRAGREGSSAAWPLEGQRQAAQHP